MNLGTEQPDCSAAAEYLRIAVPLMAKHNIPATPLNYAVWYHYVSGEVPELSAEIDRLIGECRVFCADTNAKLYRQYVAEQDFEQIDKVRSGLKQILVEVGSSLDKAGNDAHAYQDTLGGLAKQVTQQDELGDIRTLLNTLIDETRSMQTLTQGMHAQFQSKTREVEQLQEELQRERKRAITDPLTGLYNRLALIDQLNAVIGEMEEGGAPPSLVMIDIDHFKDINDKHGHLIGDRVIRFVAQILEKNIKGQDCAARYGGEEFTILLPQTPSIGARAVAEAIRKAVAHAQLVRADNKAPLGQITVSAGVATYRRGEDTIGFVDRADQAMYRSKHAGRNHVSVDDDH